MKRAALIYPLLVSAVARPHVLELLQRRPGLGLRYLKTVLEGQGVAVDLFDCLYDPVLAGRVPELVNRGDYGLVGLYSSSASLARVLETIGALDRQRLAGRIVVGGPGAVHHEELLAAGADLVVHGEAEERLPDVLRVVEGALPPSAVPGLSYRDPAGRLHTTGEAPLVDLHALPLPSWEPEGPPDGELANLIHRRPSYPVLASRGCPFRCTYCDRRELWQRRYRPRPVAQVLDELQLLAWERGARHIQFLDDIFGLAPGWLDAFCAGLQARGLDLRWSAIMHPLGFHRRWHRTLAQMRSAGCRLLYFGAQSADPAVLRRIRRSPREIPALTEALTACRAHRIASVPSYITGLPGATEASFQRSLEFVRRTRPTLVVFAPLDYLPGSELAAQVPPPEELERINRRNQRLVRRAYADYYLRHGGAHRALRFALRNNPRWFGYLARFLPGLALGVATHLGAGLARRLGR